MSDNVKRVRVIEISSLEDLVVFQKATVKKAIIHIEKGEFDEAIELFNFLSDLTTNLGNMGFLIRGM